MNPNLNLLHPYPFQKLRELFAGITPNPALKPINLSIGEPKHATPQFIKDALTQNLGGLANYPTTLGSVELRQSIAGWLARRYAIPAPDLDRQIIPVNGSREALFAFAQAVVDPGKTRPVVLSPNPFYQIYEGAALLAGAEPYYLNTLPEHDYRMDFDGVPESVWQRTQLMYVCSPGNPTGKVYNLDDWRQIFALADKYGFVIASDECYSEIYFEGSTPTPPSLPLSGEARNPLPDKGGLGRVMLPLGALQAAHQLGRDWERIVMFSSLSKRSNVPGMRSGFVAGDASILEKFLLYRTYHGCAMNPAVQAASMAAWNDEAHVVENRRLYTEKFRTVTPMLKNVLDVELPDASFYLWAKVHGSDTEFARRLHQQCNVTVLPGSFLAREAHGVNPGDGFVRIALVAPLEECVEAAERMKTLAAMSN